MFAVLVLVVDELCTDHIFHCHSCSEHTSHTHTHTHYVVHTPTLLNTINCLPPDDWGTLGSSFVPAMISPNSAYTSPGCVCLCVWWHEKVPYLRNNDVTRFFESSFSSFHYHQGVVDQLIIKLSTIRLRSPHTCYDRASLYIFPETSDYRAVMFKKPASH